LEQPIVIERIDDPQTMGAIYRIKITAFGETMTSQYSIGLSDEHDADILPRFIKNSIEHTLVSFADRLINIAYSRGGCPQPWYWEDQDGKKPMSECQEACALAAIAIGISPLSGLANMSPQQMQEHHQYQYEQMRNQMMRGNWDITADYGSTRGTDRDKKAMKLLASKIGFRKMRQLKKKGYFEEKGRHGIFHFHMNTQGGVSLIERKKYGKTEREIEWSLCVQSMAPDLPKGDVILSRWMEWKVDEDKFLDTANFRSVKTRDEATQGRA
jgi:hypothetical protein